MLPKVRLLPDTKGGLSALICFKAARPIPTRYFDRYEIHEFIGKLDVELEIAGRTYYPTLVCKLFVALTPMEKIVAQRDDDLERARLRAPFFQ